MASTVYASFDKPNQSILFKYPLVVSNTFQANSVTSLTSTNSATLNVSGAGTVGSLSTTGTISISGGNLSLSGNSLGTGSTIYRSTVSGASSLSNWFIQRGGASNDRNVLVLNADSTLSDSAISLRTGGTSRIFVKGNTGFVGIGTTAPTERLHVAGNLLVDSRINAASANIVGSLEVGGDTTVNGNLTLTNQKITVKDLEVTSETSFNWDRHARFNLALRKVRVSQYFDAYRWSGINDATVADITGGGILNWATPVVTGRIESSNYDITVTGNMITGSRTFEWEQTTAQGSTSGQVVYFSWWDSAGIDDNSGLGPIYDNREGGLLYLQVYADDQAQVWCNGSKVMCFGGETVRGTIIPISSRYASFQIIVRNNSLSTKMHVKYHWVL